MGEIPRGLSEARQSGNGTKLAWETRAGSESAARFGSRELFFYLASFPGFLNRPTLMRPEGC